MQKTVHWRTSKSIQRYRVFLAIDTEYKYQDLYKHITYGELINIIDLEGLSLCNEYRIRELKEIRKHVFRKFCNQYGFSKKSGIFNERKKDKIPYKSKSYKSSPKYR